MTPLLFAGMPLLAVVILNIPSWGRYRAVAIWAVSLIAPLQFALAVYAAARCLSTGAPIPAAFGIDFSVDLLSAVILAVIALVAGVASVVAHSTVKRKQFSFGNALLLLIAGMNCQVMVSDAFSLYVFIEAVSIASFLLIAINQKIDELEGAFKYYLMSALATMMLTLSIAMLFGLTGGTSFATLSAYARANAGAHPIALSASIIMFAAALLVKSGAIPFHTWVPDAHSSAPAPVSVVLAGVVIKVSGAYSLMRVFRDVFPVDPGIGRVLAAFGLVSVVGGALAAMGQSDIKRMLAFSSVSQIGYIVLGVSTGSPLGFFGAAAHFFNHATFKSLLFADSAVIAERTGTRDMNKMGGLAAAMPVTGVSSILGLMSMAGIPPLSGFWSKLLIVIALWRVSPGLALAALFSSALTLAYFLILQKKVFFGKAPALAGGGPDAGEPEYGTKPSAGGHECAGGLIAGGPECNAGLKFVQILLSAINVAVGLLFPALLTYLNGKGIL